MDFFNSWTLNESAIFSLADQSSPTIPSDPTLGVWQWSDQSTNTRVDIALDTGGRGSSNSSRKSSEVSEIDSSWGEKVSFTKNGHAYDLEAEDQGHHLVIDKEPTNHRIQRRRIQNRNAQRKFRQRQESERRLLEEKLTAAEQQCNMLSKKCDELNSVVNMMRDKLKRMEAENRVLRTSVIPCPGGRIRYEIQPV